MKKLASLISLVIPALITGCTSNDDPGDWGGVNGNDLNYIAVNIVQPKSADGSRAATEGGFEYGSVNENTANKASFCIFDNEGNFYDSDKKIIDVELTPAENNSTLGTNVEKVYSAILIINGDKNPSIKAKKLVCFLNLTDAQKAKINTDATNLSSLMNVIDNYTQGIDVTSAGSNGTAEKQTTTAPGLVMSTSAYYNNNTISEENKIYYTEIEKNKLKHHKDEATIDPLNVYVERVVAKVRAKAEADFTTEENNNKNGKATVIIDDTEHTFSIRITGIEVANVAQKAYISKQLPTENPFTNWNIADSHRSYWETTLISTEQTFLNKSYNTITGYNDTPTSAYNEKNLSDEQNVLTQYVLPNTSSTNTSILVTAQLMDNNSPAKTFVYLRGFYFEEENAKQEVAKYVNDELHYVKKISEEYVPLDGDDFVWSNFEKKYDGLRDYEVVPQVKSSLKGSIYLSSGSNNNSEGTLTANEQDKYDELNLILKEGPLVEGSTTVRSGAHFKARVFTNGLCYYFMEIEHFGTEEYTTENGVTETRNRRGIVRNHIYDLTLNSITGLGVAVWDPNQEIIPERPGEDLYYLAAKINVLAWKLVNQTVDFTGN